MRLIRPLAMTNANIPRKKRKLSKKKNLKSIIMGNCSKHCYKYKLWYKNYKFLSFLNPFLKRAKSATDLKL